jgi:hypothetical protein
MKTISVISTANAQKVMSGSLDLADELQKIYKREINIRTSWLWNCGIGLWLGDEVNGDVAAETVSTASEIAPWLQEAIAHFYPASTYADSLSPEVRERAAARQFLAPQRAARVNASLRAPACGDRNGGADRILAFAMRQLGQGGFTEGFSKADPKGAI